MYILLQEIKNKSNKDSPGEPGTHSHLEAEPGTYSKLWFPGPSVVLTRLKLWSLGPSVVLTHSKLWPPGPSVVLIHLKLWSPDPSAVLVSDRGAGLRLPRVLTSARSACQLVD